MFIFNYHLLCFIIHYENIVEAYPLPLIESVDRLVIGYSVKLRQYGSISSRTIYLQEHFSNGLDIY